MNATIRKSLIAGAIAALVGAPAWAGDMSDKSGARHSSESSAQMGSAYSQSNSLYSMTAQELRRMDVIDANGQEIGSVHSVVQSRDQQGIQLVIAPGELESDKNFAVPLNEASLVGDKIQLNASASDLQGRQEQFQAEQFVELQPTDQPISDFAAFEPIPQGQEGEQRWNEPTPNVPYSSDPTRSSPTDEETSGAPWVVPR